MSDRPSAINIGRPKFLSEQNGPFEDQLKHRLCSMFDRIGGITKAYLLRVSYEGGFDFGVILGVSTDEKKMNSIVPQVGEVFSTLFSSDQCLDIVLLEAASEAEAALVCKPFYVKLQ